MNQARHKLRKAIAAALGTLLPVLVFLAGLNLYANREINRQIEKGNFFVLSSSYFQTHPGDAIQYTLKPNLDGYMDSPNRVPIRTNEQGFRTQPFSAKGRAKRILLLGDSIAFGYGLAEEQTLAIQLKRSLYSGGLEVEVFNLGIPTYSIHQVFPLYERYVDALQPDMVVYQFTVGDLENMPPFLAAGNLDRIGIVKWLRFRIHAKQLQKNRSSFFDSGLELFTTMVADSRKMGLPFLMLYFPILQDEDPGDAFGDEDMRAMAPVLADLCNVAEPLLATGRPLSSFRLWKKDSIHPSAEALALIVEHILPHVTKMLYAEGDL